ncbi:peptide chain release factor 2 [Mesosutterella sp. OilRF-GAM-744-9]|uniref:Peptide chain release factor 2 n=1 Tax=Mesosutterella porci TaxID=2915351 RepID=A0ABS9MSZ2_9BURK|nr:peptide chain release factor 2 [Mesosutterella sp. oilRF-744-WT-GAM-9]MCG5031724.1 peptide chain release factor 2 [Mesosutterella sp. oilRF-744-WT-GAM-9]MCI6530418.1 peptide chain release factor 2 [Mesosutterella sp.]
MEAEQLNQIEHGIADLGDRLKGLRGYLDIDRKTRRLEELNREIENPNLWDDPKHAEKITREKKLLEDTVLTFNKLESGIRDSRELFEMSTAEEDWPAVESIGQDVDRIRSQVEKLEFKRMFNQPMDSANCYLEIQAGAGGTEAQDWSSMLERMYLKYTESKGFTVKLNSETEGDVAGIKNCSIYVQGDWAYGTLRTETGIHRLVRKSPFDSNARRHTSFASVYVYPEVDDSIEIEINPADLRIDVYRSSGAGGQHIQKTESAVRITHLPTGIVTECQDERSQHQNKDRAMQQLRAKLYEYEMQKRRAEQQKLEDAKDDIGWGHQIRSYVLDQSRVKDLRTGVENTNTTAVLNGDLDGFIEASLKQGV